MLHKYLSFNYLRLKAKPRTGCINAGSVLILEPEQVQEVTWATE